MSPRRVTNSRRLTVSYAMSPSLSSKHVVLSHCGKAQHHQRIQMRTFGVIFFVFLCERGVITKHAG